MSVEPFETIPTPDDPKKADPATPRTGQAAGYKVTFEGDGVSLIGRVITTSIPPSACILPVINRRGVTEPTPFANPLGNTAPPSLWSGSDTIRLEGRSRHAR
jgi:hypothetical protein